MDIVVTLIILVTALTLYISERLPIIVTALLTLCALVLSGVLGVDAALSGFSNPATITIAAMFILSEGLVRTGALDPVTQKMEDWSKGSPFRLILILGVTVPIASAFVNNTPIVVMMVPVVMTLCRKIKVSPSKLFIPLSYFSIFGGTCTLMGTSTNLLIDGLYRQQGGAGFNMFEFSSLGIVFVGIGLVYMMLLGNRLLPERDSLSFLLPVERRSTYVTEVIVNKASPLRGKRLTELFPREGKVRFLELLRGEDVYLGDAHDLVVSEDDALIVEGTAQALTDLLENMGTQLATVIEDDARVRLKSMSLFMVELVILPDSRFVGRMVREIGLNRQYGVKVMAIQRSGRQHRVDLRQMKLKAGDILLVQSETKGINLLRESGEVLVVEGMEKSIRKTRKVFVALGIMAAVVSLAVVSDFPLAILALTGAATMILTGCLRVEDAVKSLDVNVLFLLIGTIPLGQALVDIGLIGQLVDGMMLQLGRSSPLLIIAVIYVLTNVMTALLSNTTVAVLMTPVAIGLATSMGVDPKPYLMAVAFGASTCLASPIGYQTNLIVMGPAGYTFRDFFVVGMPLTVILTVVATFLIPVFWPL